MIVDLLMKELNRRLEEQELTIRLTEEAKRFVIDGGYDPVYGARPLKRYVQKHVETLAARLILSGQIRAGEELVIGVENGALKAERSAV